MIKVRPYTKSARTGYEVDIRFDWPDGSPFRRRYRAPVQTEAQAIRWGQARERELYARGKPDVPLVLVESEMPTLEKAFPKFITEHCKANRHKPSGIARKENAFDVWIKPLLGTKRLDEIDTKDIVALKSKLAARSAKSANNVLTTLSATLKFFGPDGLKGSPGLGILSKVPRVPLLRVSQGDVEWYEAADLERLKAGARDVEPDDVYVMILIGADAGLRRGEILSLKWSDLDFARRIVHVRRAVWNGQEETPKSGKGRKVTMTKELHDALTTHKAKHGKRGERVVYDENGRTPTNTIVRHWMQRAQRAAGLEPTGKIHVLRHTFCSRLAAAGVPVGVIKELAGHSSLTTTMRYMHLSPTSLETAIAMLDRAVFPVQVGETLEKETGS